jgi:hypothetical protein
VSAQEWRAFYNNCVQRYMYMESIFTDLKR